MTSDEGGCALVRYLGPMCILFQVQICGVLSALHMSSLPESPQLEQLMMLKTIRTPNSVHLPYSAQITSPHSTLGPFRGVMGTHLG